MKLLFNVGLVLLAGAVNAQGNLYRGFPSKVWPLLYQVAYTTNQTTGELIPVFSAQVQQLHGKEIVVPGYLVPYQNNTLKSDHFMLSSTPLNACFFCGVGGPETALEVFSKDAVRYTDKPVELRGRLELNATDPARLIYLLKDAVLVGEIDF